MQIRRGLYGLAKTYVNSAVVFSSKFGELGADCRLVLRVAPPLWTVLEGIHANCNMSRAGHLPLKFSISPFHQCTMTSKFILYPGSQAYQELSISHLGYFQCFLDCPSRKTLARNGASIFIAKLSCGAIVLQPSSSVEDTPLLNRMIILKDCLSVFSIQHMQHVVYVYLRSRLRRLRVIRMTVDFLPRCTHTPTRSKIDQT